MKRPVKAPLLVTRCDGCLRRRACHADAFRSWLCKACHLRAEVRAGLANYHFRAQGR